MTLTASKGERPSVCVVLVTIPDADAGLELARRLVAENLAACGNLIPGLKSVYRWKGEIQEDPEALLVLKTTEERLPDLKKRVLELHSYEVPEFLALPVGDGYDPYLRWVAFEVGRTGISE